MNATETPASTFKTKMSMFMNTMIPNGMPTMVPITNKRKRDLSMRLKTDGASTNAIIRLNIIET